VKINNSLLILIVFCVFTLTFSYADDVRRISTDGPVEVLGIVGHTNEIYFESGISSLVRSGVKQTLSVEQMNDHLFVTPLSETPADLIILDLQGQSYKLHFIFGKGYDDKIVVSAASAKQADGKGDNSTIGLIRQLYLNQVPEGSTEKKANRVVFDNGQLRLSLITVYELPKVLAYVMVCENLLDRSIIVPVEQVNFPRLLAVSSEKDLLTAKGTDGALTKVFMVVGK
jgi:hypothetical protein